MNISYKKGDVLTETLTEEGVTALLGKSKEGTPLFAILQVEDAIYLKTADEPDFEDVLKGLEFV